MPWAVRLLFAIVVAAALAGCRADTSPSATVAGSPVMTVQSAVAMAEAKQFDQLSSLACPARQAEVEARLDLVPDMAAALPPEITTAQGLSALEVSFDQAELDEASRLGDLATVRLVGTLRVSVDRVQVRQLIQQVGRARGTPVSDSVADALADAFAARVQARQVVDATIPLAAQQGRWLICW
ncbi:MAG TPA: hypothetical protein VEI48_04385 [Candidatus Sulfotelmatobacter sp.]|nr:hypothetical protein [Candidatus Sulfotelmatobacter sp.]